MSVCVKIGGKVQNIVLNTEQSFDRHNNISCDKFIEKVMTAVVRGKINICLQFYIVSAVGKFWSR